MLHEFVLLLGLREDLLALAIGVASRVVALQVQALVLLHELAHVAIRKHVLVLLLHERADHLRHFVEEALVRTQENLSVDDLSAHLLNVLASQLTRTLIIKCERLDKVLKMNSMVKKKV